MALFNVGEKYRNTYTIEHVVPFFDGELAISHCDSKRYYLQSAHLKKQAPSRAIQQYRSLIHPLVIPFTEVYTEDRSLVFIRPYCSIVPLREVVMKEDVSEDKIVQWGKQLLLLAAELKTKAMPMYLLTDPRNIGLDDAGELKVLYCGVEHITALRPTLDWGTFFYSLVSKEHLEGSIDKVPNDFAGSRPLHRLIQKSLQNNSIDSILSQIEVYEKKRNKKGIFDIILGGGKKETPKPETSSDQDDQDDQDDNSSESSNILPSRPEQIVGPEPTLADSSKNTDIDYLEKLRRELERQQQEQLERQRLEMERQRQEMERKHQELLKQLELERKIREQLERERLNQESSKENNEEQEHLEQERLEQEHLEQERLEQERLEQERLEQERLEQERLEQERLEQERLERERLERERLEQERLEQERLERERLEQERLEQERLERERLERERLERERREWERRERERLEQELQEAIRLELEKLKEERLEWERREQERLERARLEFKNREQALIKKLNQEFSQKLKEILSSQNGSAQFNLQENAKMELNIEQSEELKRSVEENSFQNLDGFTEQAKASTEGDSIKQESSVGLTKESEEHERLARQFEEYMKQMYKNK